MYVGVSVCGCECVLGVCWCVYMIGENNYLL